MMKVQSGFSVVEVLVSLIILAVGVLGFLQLTTHSQRAVNQSDLQQQLFNMQQQIREQLAVTTNSCPACYLLKQLQHEHINQSTWHFKRNGSRTIVATYCQTEHTCIDNTITV